MRQLVRKLGERLAAALMHRRVPRIATAASRFIESLEPRRLLDGYNPVGTIRDIIFDQPLNELEVVSPNRVIRIDARNGWRGQINFGNSMSGGDVTPDGRWLYIGDVSTNGYFKLQKVDLTDNSVSEVHGLVPNTEGQSIADVAMLSD